MVYQWGLMRYIKKENFNRHRNHPSWNLWIKWRFERFVFVAKCGSNLNLHLLALKCMVTELRKIILGVNGSKVLRLSTGFFCKIWIPGFWRSTQVKLVKSCQKSSTDSGFNQACLCSWQKNPVLGYGLKVSQWTHRIWETRCRTRWGRHHSGTSLFPSACSGPSSPSSSSSRLRTWFSTTRTILLWLVCLQVCAESNLN